jgi:hypothetical protein
LLLATLLCAALGVWVIARDRLRDTWWRYVLYALAIAPVPASLTVDYGHMLRLIPLPVMLICVAIPGIEFLTLHRQKLLLGLIALAVIQGAVFQWKFHVAPVSEWRAHLFDAHYRTRIFERAVATGSRPIYIADERVIPGYIQAYWYSTLARLDLTNIVRLALDEPAPMSGLVITTEEHCTRCDILDRVEPYTLYITNAPPAPRVPLPDDGFRAEISIIEMPAAFRAGEPAVVRVRVANVSGRTWRARERSAGKFHVGLGNRWLATAGSTLINDDGRAALMTDLAPREAVELTLKVNAPPKRGDYILELDMLQEGVSWFVTKGSAPVRVEVRID